MPHPQGIPSGTSSTIPRQRFVLSRLEQALPRQQREAVADADAAARAAHKSDKARESLVGCFQGWGKNSSAQYHST